ncbi:MAG: hypothetical protein K2X27_18680 [Candidatus Obscuribacterales bacterium]|nr:hypothetical protein [Candidatus Obscuribacterales bacterium]
MTSNIPNPINLFNPNGPGSLDGLNISTKFPQVADLRGSKDFILVLPGPSSVWAKVSDYAASLTNGQLLVGVRKPSTTGMIVTSNANIAIYSNGQGADVLVTMKDGVLRLANLDGLGENVRIQLTGDIFGPLKGKVFNLKPGFELVASSTPLTKRDLRPNDGIGRRQTQLIENKHVAISQFSLESVLKGSDLIANMQQKDTGSKERRILADMSKMAAVLNQVGGTWGYEGQSDKGEKGERGKDGVSGDSGKP